MTPSAHPADSPKIAVDISIAPIALRKGLVGLLNEKRHFVLLNSKSKLGKRPGTLPAVSIIDNVDKARLVFQADPNAAAATVFLADSADDPEVMVALRSGINCVVLADTSAKELAAAVIAAANGRVSLAPAVAHMVMAELRRPQDVSVPDPEALSMLSPREIEIVVALCKGQTNAEIAAQLGLESGTVKSHMSRAMSKVRVKSRVELAAWAFRARIAN